MKYSIDTDYLLSVFKTLVNTPSPVGYYRLLNPVLENLATSFGETLTYDRRGTPYLILDREDNSRTVMVGAHADTIGQA